MHKCRLCDLLLHGFVQSLIMQQQFQKMKESQLEMKRRLVDMRLGSNSNHRQKENAGQCFGNADKRLSP